MQMKSHSHSMVETQEHGIRPIVLYDRYLLLATIALLVLGLLMVASTSIVISERLYSQPFHYLFRQLLYLVLGIILAVGAFRMGVSSWQKLSVGLLFVCYVLLALVLVHGIGREVNGSMRWLGFGPFGMQVSELTKVAAIIYLAGYLVRHDKQVRTKVSGFAKPLLLFALLAVLLLREPDFGAATVILATALGMLFLAGVRLWQFAVLLGIVVVAFATLAFTSPYRLLRLTTFLHPWVAQFNSGYQLTQSLIAFGRGGWFGVGLGESIQKLFYLPEAHTDFLFAVLTEELGLLGGLVVIALFVIVVARAMMIGRKAYIEGRFFAAYLAYGFGMELALQVMINIGVNTGMLPTKGLTLPFMSYGGSSLLMMCVIVAILLRIDHESRLMSFGYRNQRS